MFWRTPLTTFWGFFCLPFFVFGVFCLFVFSFVGFIFQRGEFSEAKPYKFSLVNMQHIKWLVKGADASSRYGLEQDQWIKYSLRGSTRRTYPFETPFWVWFLCFSSLLCLGDMNIATQFHLKKASILNRYLVSATGCVHGWRVAWDRAVILYTCHWRGSEILSRMFFRKCQLIQL